MTGTRKYIVDTTLRDGEQAPGVVFLQHEKKEIAASLNEMGIDELEIGTPAMGEEELRDMQAIVAMQPNFRTIAWCRATKNDIDAAVEAGVDAVNISFPVSSILLAAMDRDLSWVLKLLEELLPYAKHKFKYVYVGAQDASRAEYHFLKLFASRAFSLGANRVRIADTVGVMNPVSVAELFSKLLTDFSDADFEFHPHNDMGMATANAFMALMSGASGVSCTVNGLGERAGNAALEELVVAMNQTSTLSTTYDISKISVLSKLVQKYSGQDIHASKPIVGENAFSHESGIHTRCLMKNKLAYQPFDEALIGKKSHRIVYGKHSGKASVERFFKEKGIVLNAIETMMMMTQIKNMAIKTKHVLSDHHLLNVYNNMFS